MLSYDFDQFYNTSEVRLNKEVYLWPVSSLGHLLCCYESRTVPNRCDVYTIMWFRISYVSDTPWRWGEILCHRLIVYVPVYMFSSRALSAILSSPHLRTMSPLKGRRNGQKAAVPGRGGGPNDTWLYIYSKYKDTVISGKGKRVTAYTLSAVLLGHSNER